MAIIKKEIARSIITLVLWCFLIVILLILVPFIFVMLVVRLSEALFFYLRYGARAIRNTDVLWTFTTPENPMNISGALQLDDDVDLQVFRKLINERLVEKRVKHGKLMYPQVRQHIKPGLINYYWRNDKKFDITEHVYYLQRELVSSKRELENVISKHQEGVFPRDPETSPWEFVLIPYVTDTTMKKTIVLFRLKHLIADGSALAYFLINQLSDSTNETGTMVKKFTHKQRILLNLRALWYLPYAYLQTLCNSKETNCLHSLKPSGVRRFTWSNQVDLSTIKRIKNGMKTTVNDVLVGCFAKSIGDYFNLKGKGENKTFSTIFAVDTRKSAAEAKYFNNDVAGIIVSLPINSPSLVDSVRASKKRFDEMKSICEPIAVNFGWSFLSFLLPASFSKYFVFKQVQRTTAILSNLIGPQYPVYINGHLVDFVTFWPPGTFTQTMAVSFCSYNDEIRVGIETDSSVLHDSSVITEIFEKNVIELGKYVDSAVERHSLNRKL